MANDTTKVLRYIFRADADNAKKALKDFDGATNASEANLSRASKRMSSDLAKVEEAARRAARSQKLPTPGTAAGGAIRNVAEAALQGSVSPLSTIQSSLLGQFGGAEKILSGVSVAAIGAGAAVAGIGFAAGKLGTEAVQSFRSLASAVDNFQDVAGGSAEQASRFVNVARLLGVSSESVSKSMGFLLKNVNGNEDALRRYGATVVRTSDGTVDTIATTKSIAAAFANIPDPARRAELGALAFGRSWADMADILERGGKPLENLFAAADKGPILSDQDLAKAKEFEVQLQMIGLQWDKLKVAVGKPILTRLSEDIAGIQSWGQTVGGWIDTIDKKVGDLDKKAGTKGLSDWFNEGVKNVLKTPIRPFLNLEEDLNRTGKSAKEAAGSFDPLQTELDYTGFEAQFLAEKLNITAGSIYTLQASLTSVHSSWANLNFEQTNAIDTQDKYADSLSAFDDISAKAADSVSQVGAATDRSARQIADAEKAIADANQGVADAVVERTKAVEDANRRMIDVEERAAKRIVDAQNRVADARERADRTLRDAARRLEDAQQAANDAQVNSLKEDDPYKAQRAREEAAKDLTRAEQDYRDSQSDAVKGVADAEKDLADASTESAKDRSDAQRQYADAVEAANKRVVDAQDRVRDATDRMARTIDDAAAAMENAGGKAGGHTVKLSELDGASNTLVTNTAGLVASMIARGASWTDINAVIDGAKAKLQGVEGQFGYTGYAADIYTGQLNNIPRDILSIVHLTLDAYQYKQDLATLAKNFVDPLTKSYVSLGVVDVPGGSYTLPQYNRDSGGPLPPGSSIVHNLSGQTEWVATAEQMRSMGGRTENHFHIAGSVVDAKGLAGVIAQLRRQGFNFGDN